MPVKVGTICLCLQIAKAFLYLLLGPGRSGDPLSAASVNHTNHTGSNNNALTSPDSGTSSEAKASLSTAAPPTLSIATFPQVLIAPKEHVTYEKQTQTTATQSTSSQDRGKKIAVNLTKNTWPQMHLYKSLPHLQLN